MAFEANLNELLTGYRAQSIREGGSGGYIRTVTDKNGKKKELRYAGLLDTLRAACFPKFDFKKARSIANTPKHLLAPTGLSHPMDGLDRGRLIHSQVRLFINSGGEIAVEDMFSNVKGQSAAGASLTASFLTSLKALNLVPIRSEYAFYDEKIALASSIDLLCRHTDPVTGAVSLALIEMKTGYENTFRDSIGSLIAPARLRGEYNDSPLTQAYLQLAFYRHAIRTQFPNVTLGPCYVAQIRNNDTLYYKLPQDMIDAGSDLLRAVGDVRMRRVVASSAAKAKRAHKASSAARGTRKPRKPRTKRV